MIKDSFCIHDKFIFQTIIEYLKLRMIFYCLLSFVFMSLF